MLIPVSVPGGAFTAGHCQKSGCGAKHRSNFCASLAKRLTALRAELGGWAGSTGVNHTGCTWRVPVLAWGCRSCSRTYRCWRCRSCIPSYRLRVPGRLRAAAVGAEFAGVAGLAAAAGPACGSGCRGRGGLCGGLLLGTHLVQPCAFMPPAAPAIFMPIKAMAGPAPLISQLRSA